MGKWGAMDNGWFTHFSSTLDLPADWLPTYKKGGGGGRKDSSMGVQRVSTARSLRTTTSWGMSSSPPTKATHDVGVIKLSKR
jgi:hypothetical protein